MNNTTIKVLARATPQFNISFNNEDTKPWSVRKTLRCGNCKTVACNRKTCTRSFLILESFDRPYFNCSTVGCHFRHCPHPMDEARCERNKTRFLTSSNDRPCFNCSIVGCHFRKCPHPIDEARCKRNKTRFGNKTRSLMSSSDASKRAVMASVHRDSQRDINDRHSTRKTSSTSYLKVPPVVSSQATNQQRMAWVEEKNKAAAIADAMSIDSTVSDAARQTTPEFTKGGRLIPYEWRSPSPHELGKRVIHGRPHTYKTNGSWNGSWMLDTNPDSDSSLTPEDAAAATAIAMSITGQKTAGAALDAASAAAQAIMLQTTIGEKIHDGTPTTEITQSQANEIYGIQANLSNRATTIKGMSSYLRKFGTQK